MTGFAALFPAADILSALGDAAVFKRGLTETALDVIVTHNVERMGNEGYMMEPHTEIEYLRADLGVNFQPQKGDRFTVSGVTYCVEALAESDTLFQKVIVKHG